MFFPYYRLQPSILQEVLRLECAKDVGWKTSEGVEGGVRTPGTPRISPHFQLLSTWSVTSGLCSQVNIVYITYRKSL